MRNDDLIDEVLADSDAFLTRANDLRRREASQFVQERMEQAAEKIRERSFGQKALRVLRGLKPST
ncbi:hypothetical protein [Herbidospora daliensis]|uniref:hypothetical protein n=1 Tax=Herbidospora daliensis TaxID=295585 RepID=UPI000784BBC5|nr:hypothetical protein [Herbidospora daliensis]